MTSRPTPAATPAATPASPGRRRLLHTLGVWGAASGLGPLGLAGCATALRGADAGAGLATSDWARASQLTSQGAWEHHIFPQRRPTRYTPGWHHDRPALHADSDAGTSAVRFRLRVPAAELRTVGWSWWIDALNPAFDPTDRDSEDAVARVILAFEGHRDRWTGRDHTISELARLVTGEPLPDATLMYIWDARLPMGTVVPNAATARVRKLVVASGPEGLTQWRAFERDPVADMAHAFGETPTALVSVGLMTDANNTASHASAWYGPVGLARR